MFNNVKLTVYDVLGQEIATLVNEQLKPALMKLCLTGRIIHQVFIIMFKGR
jgi:hypothetical protein